MEELPYIASLTHVHRCLHTPNFFHVYVFVQEVTESDELILMYRFYYHMTLDRYVGVLVIV